MAYKLLKIYPPFIILSILILFSSCKSKKFITDASGPSSKNISGNLKERYSIILGVSSNMLANEKLYTFIDSWMGVPHRIGGLDKNGIDCSGFAVLLEKEVYLKSLPRTATQMADQVKRKYEEDLKEGDLVFFNFDGQKFSHVGVYLQNNKFVHASTSKGIMISDLKNPWYYKYFSRAGNIQR
ncbi:MAG: C40 family peptidase [Flavobacterium sp.]|nr:C40 family peptidase [Pedobacter sp.]